MEITICKAEKIHIPGVYQLVEELAIYENGRHEMTMTLQNYLDLYEEEAFESIVALSNHDVIGTCVYYNTFSTWKGKMLYLEDFIVKEAYRQSGVGQLLFDQLIEIAKDRGCALAKWQVLDWNEPAIKFYEKNNAIFEKEWWNCKVIF